MSVLNTSFDGESLEIRVMPLDSNTQLGIAFGTKTADGQQLRAGMRFTKHCTPEDLIAILEGAAQQLRDGLALKE